MLVVGESLVDVIRTADGTTTRMPGGSAANVAVALARLGRRTALATSWANDENGRLLGSHLTANGVSLASDPVLLQETSTALATIGADGSATYSFAVDWQVGPPEGVHPAAIHVCSLGAVLPPGADDVRRLVAALHEHTLVSFDVNLRPEVSGVGEQVRDRIEWLARHSDLVKASDEDLEMLYPLRSVDASAQALLALGPGAVVVTRGPDSAWCYTAEGRLEVPTGSVTVVDTIGAGDTVFVAERVERDLWTDVKDVLLVASQILTIYLTVKTITGP